MLHRITTLTDPIASCLKDDPVRPEIPTAARLHDHADIFMWLVDGQPGAVTCVSYTGSVPDSVGGLTDYTKQDHAVFYTIWSYRKGAGRSLIRAAQQWIKENRLDVTTFVTLSPKTELARQFHHANGAATLRENAETVNYAYPAA